MSDGGTRLAIRRLRQIMAAEAPAQARLDEIVSMIAGTMVADVCSVYLRRGDDTLELFATEGLDRAAVHRTRLNWGEGLVGLVAEQAAPFVTEDAARHPRFSYRPETGEDPYAAFLGVPLLKATRVLGVMVVQNRAKKVYLEEEVDALETIAMAVAELVSRGDFGALSDLGELALRPVGQEVLDARAFAPGIAIGTAMVLDQGGVATRLFADDPAAEEVRLYESLARVRTEIDAMLESQSARLSEESREVLDTFRMLAADKSWANKLRDAVRAGLSAEAAVERVRREHRARLMASKDQYLRERLSDFADLDARLLRALSHGQHAIQLMPQDPILVARDVGPAQLLELGPRLRGLILEEGGASSHAAIVAKALGIPMLGHAQTIVQRVESGDRVIIDGQVGRAILRPDSAVEASYGERERAVAEQAARYAAERHLPCTTRDGTNVSLLLNAGLAIDLRGLDETGAQGVGLFRTEFQFMITDRMPAVQEQTAFYREVLDAAGERPVVFRTLDVGGDKVWHVANKETEPNPALGWRALRIGLDRPAILRLQLRALLMAASGRERLDILLPMVTVASEFQQARAAFDLELARARRMAGFVPPRHIQIGAMVETPSAAWAIRDLIELVDFVSIGTNDLVQYFFAADRGNPLVSDRYDLICKPFLQMIETIASAANAAGKPCTVCGEAGGRPLEALALVAMGVRRLSMPAGAIGPVRQLLRGLDLAQIRQVLVQGMNTNDPDLRKQILTEVQRCGFMLEAVDNLKKSH